MHSSTKSLFCKYLALLLLVSLYLFSNVSHSRDYGTVIYDSDKFNVLVVYTYPAHVSWSEQLQTELNRLNREYGFRFNFDVVYLDYYKRHDKEYVRAQARAISKKKPANGKEWDAIVAYDDFAATLVASHEGYIQNEDIKLFILGITDGYLGDYEIESDHEVSIDTYDVNGLILAITSTIDEIDSIHIVVDQTSFGNYMFDSIYGKLASFFDVPIFITREKPISELHDIIKSKTKNDVVVLGSYRLRNNPDTNFFYGDQIIDSFELEDVDASVFVTIGSHIRSGVLGGKVRSATLQAEHAFQLLWDTLVVGLPTSNQTVYKTYARYKWDYDALISKGISIKKLPKNSTVLNTPVVHEDNVGAVIGTTVLVLVLLGVILLQRKLHIQKLMLKEQVQQKKQELLSNQKEILAMLGGVIETRSGETGNHVHRVSLISEKLALLLGIPQDDAETLGLVSVLHDIGKVSVPDAILNKPGKLTETEFATMQKHTTIGYEMLSNTNSELIQLAAFVAHEHHEKWNGKGYPLGKAKEEIHVFSRIVAIVDVFDALLSTRPYKAPWPPQRVYDLISEERGEHFDPEIADVFLENFDTLLAIHRENDDTIVCAP